MTALKLLVPLATAAILAHVTVHAAMDRVLFAGDDVHARRLPVPASERMELANHPDALVVHLTAELEGRRAPAEATWQPAGTTVFDNRARTRFDAIVIELLAPAAPSPAPLPVEALPDRVDRYAREHHAAGLRVRTVVDNPRVLVTHHRLPAWQPRLERLHMHPRGVVIVYLSGGEIAGSTGRTGARRIRRGDIDVLPAGIWHAFRNAGNDPIEFLMVTPK